MVNYYPYTGTTGTNWTSSTEDYANTSTNYSSTTTWTYVAFVRRMLVCAPKCWSKEVVLKFAELLNVETNTGWKVTMVIDGDVTITDPAIEVRTMENFLPLLRMRACLEDGEKIELFLKAHPIA